MVSYGYTLDHIAPERGTAFSDAGGNADRRYPFIVCCALIFGSSVVLWTGLIEAFTRLVQ